jgi:hypothetical protein
MKRFHAHVRVSELKSSVHFYSNLFGIEPAVLKADYAKWMLNEPLVNFAITEGSATAGPPITLGCRSNPTRSLRPSPADWIAPDNQEAGERGMLLRAW